MEWELKVTFGVAIACVIAAVAFGYKEDQKWEAFKIAHDCHIVGKSPGTTTPIIGVDGKTRFAISAGTESYLCNDGITYTREK